MFALRFDNYKIVLKCFSGALFKFFFINNAIRIIFSLKKLAVRFINIERAFAYSFLINTNLFFTIE